jgi:L-lactate dehydrogenase complex protein LldG
MSSKETILSNIKKNIKQQFDMPDISIQGIQYEDKLAQFIAISKAVGGNVQLVKKGEDINEIIRKLYPEAKTIASNLPEITIATANPDTIATPQELNDTDVAIARGEVGVAENGCIWIPQDVKEKAVYFIAEYLVILLQRDKIVNNMHEAYKAIHFNDYGFGSFISGPSKTADIEQALVMGAQSAKGVTVLLTEE